MTKQKQASPANESNSSPKAKSILKEGEDIAIASAMISLGARLQILEQETGLSYDRLSKLYREIKGCSAPKGMLPFSTDWFMSWHPNLHASIFYSIYRYLEKNTPSQGVRALVQAYQLYLEHENSTDGTEPVLSFTRSWILLRFINIGSLRMSTCNECNHEYITKPGVGESFVCSICRPPARIVGMLAKDGRRQADEQHNENDQTNAGAELDDLASNENGAEGTYLGRCLTA